MSLDELGQSTALATPTTTSGVVVSTNIRTLLGWSVAESTGLATAKFRLRDGTGVSGKLIAPLTLAANESARDWFAEQALVINSGALFLEMVSGSIEGTVYWG